MWHSCMCLLCAIIILLKEDIYNGAKMDDLFSQQSETQGRSNYAFDINQSLQEKTETPMEYLG